MLSLLQSLCIRFCIPLPLQATPHDVPSLAEHQCAAGTGAEMGPTGWGGCCYLGEMHVPTCMGVAVTPSRMLHPPSCGAARASSSTGSSFFILPSPRSLPKPFLPGLQQGPARRRGRAGQLLASQPAQAGWESTRRFAGLSRSGWAVAREQQIPHSSSLRCTAGLPSLHANSKQAVIIPDALNNCGYFFSSQYSKKAKNSLRFLSQLFFPRSLFFPSHHLCDLEKPGGRARWLSLLTPAPRPYSGCHSRCSLWLAAGKFGAKPGGGATPGWWWRAGSSPLGTLPVTSPG